MEVAYEEPGRQVFFPALNLSASGIFLGSREPPDVGAEVQVVLSLPPDGVFLRMHGLVVRHAAPVEPDGFAVAFADVDERTRNELNDFVRACRRA
jgi:hypothetical protein